MTFFEQLKYKRLQNEVLILTVLSWLTTFVLKTTCLYFAWNKFIVPRMDCLRLPILAAICFEICIELYSKVRIDFAFGSRKELKKMQDIMTVKGGYEND